MTIADLRQQNLILFEAVSGSRAYGTNLPHSDTDLKGVFMQFIFNRHMPLDMVMLKNPNAFYVSRIALRVDSRFGRRFF